LIEITVIRSKQHISLSSGDAKLKSLGTNIKLARKRRKWSENELSQRAAIARSTLQLIEQGRPSVSIGSYYQVLEVLGLEKDFEEVARADEPGRRIVDEKLLGKKT
jgi:transcriptional regulator with XRE-family HTH domain